MEFFIYLCIMITTGIYKILNKINNKVYIGSAINIGKRWQDQRWHLKNNIHHNSHLQSAWNKYGEDSFEFMVLLECKINVLLLNETNLILEYNSFNNNYGYNVNDPEHMFLNRKHTEKTKKILSIQKIGNKNPMFGKCGDKHHNFNKKMSNESRKKMSLSRKDIPTNKRNNVKLNESDIPIIRKMYYEEKISQPNIALKFGVSYTAINKIIKKRTWVNIVAFFMYLIH